MSDGQQPQDPWDRIIVPASSYLILGDVGTGKSALCYWLLERYSQKYGLKPVTVGLPANKVSLLPEGFLPLGEPDDLTKVENVIALIDEADIQLPIEDTKARKYVTNFLSLPRHRHQIFLLAFHFPRLVMGRYLPFFSAFLLKRPPYLIEFASKRKEDALSDMMRKAEERYVELVPPNWEPTEQQLQPLSVVQNTYVVAPRLRWQGMLPNPVPSFWTQELSQVWAGTEVTKCKQEKQVRLPTGLVSSADGKTPITEEMRARSIKLEQLDMNPPNKIFIDPFTNVKWVE